jgi:hypothetical protein
VEEPSEDNPNPPGARPTSDFENNVKSRSTWLRLFFMIVIGALYEIARFVTIVVVILQFFHVLFTGKVNEQLRAFGQSLATYTLQVVTYLTFNSEVRPFPFDAPWPQAAP